MPASTFDCGTFIRQQDGQLLEVLNVKIPDFYLEKGGAIAFGYTENDDWKGSCDLGKAVKLHCVWTLKGPGPGSDTEKTETSNTN